MDYTFYIKQGKKEKKEGKKKKEKRKRKLRRLTFVSIFNRENETKKEVK